MPARPAAWPCAVALAAACGRSPYDLDAAGDAAATTASTSSTPDPTLPPITTATTDPPPPPVDLPPPELSCEAQGGRFTLIGGPWTLLSHVLYHSPGYALLPDDDGMLAIVRGEFFGQDPEPNFLGARVAYDGQLLSGVASVWNTPVLIEPAVHRAAEGFLVTFCGRFGFDDLLASQILDARGQPLATETIRNPDGHCGAARPEGVWTGEAYLFSWIDNSSMQIFLDVADAETTSLGVTELALEGDLSAPPRMAVGTDSVLLVVGAGVDAVLAFSLAHDGTILDSYALEQPPDYDAGPLAVGAHPDGSFSVYLAHRDVGLYHTRIDADGQSPPTRIEGTTAHFHDLLLLHRSGGLLLVSAAYEEDFVERIWIIPSDDSGTPTAIEPLEPGPGGYFEAWPAVTMHDGEAWVLYVSAYEDETYDIRLAQLGCAR